MASLFVETSSRKERGSKKKTDKQLPPSDKNSLLPPSPTNNKVTGSSYYIAKAFSQHFQEGERKRSKKKNDPLEKNTSPYYFKS